MNTPNKLTLLRIVLVPLMVAAFYIPWKYAYVAAAIIFIAGAITDTLDGNIARKRGLITTFGKFMDPIADKILVGAALIMLTSIGTVSPIVTLIVVGREFVVSGVRLLMAEKGVATNVHYKPLPMHTAYKNLGFDIKDYPVAYAKYSNEITLPLHTLLTDEEVDYVVDSFRKSVQEVVYGK